MTQTPDTPSGPRATQQPAPVAVVGSPSSNYEITLDILDAHIHEPLVGSMLYLTHPSGDGEELALGTVTDVTTENQWHTNPSLRGVVKARGAITGMSGDSGDVRRAAIKLQAAYKTRVAGDGWVQSGPSLRMSPPTGTPIRKATNEVLDELIAGEEGIHYLGHLHGSTTRVPFQIRDFAGSRGAFSSVLLGKSGSGKTAFGAYFLAGQMRHPDQGLIVVDPQGQWSHERELPFSLQAWAQEMGRTVEVCRISEDLRLDENAPLFGELITKTEFLSEIMKMSEDTKSIVVRYVIATLRATANWGDMAPEDVLDVLMRALREPKVLRKVYADKTRRADLMVALSEILNQPCVVDIDNQPLDPTDIPLEYEVDTANFGPLRAAALAQFKPLHNLFSATNPAGTPRRSLWGAISKVFDRQSRGTAPAPMLVLDMSTSGGSWIDSVLADDEAQEAQGALALLDQDSIKATILREVFRTLKRASESAFRNDENLNTNVVLDEAARFAPPPGQASDPEIRSLSEDLAGYARDTRKFGIGWTYITQTPRQLNPDIWDQLLIRVVGHGLAGGELERVGEQVDDRDHLKLYKGFAPPDSTRPKVYPFMLLGPVSPLSFSNAPILLSAYTDFDEFRDHNRAWIEQIRLAQGKQVLSGTPARPDGRSTLSGGAAASAGGSGARSRVSAPSGRRAQEQIARVRENRETGGVDPAAGVGLATGGGFGSGLDVLEGDEPPF